jgi:hypothetical protein
MKKLLFVLIILGFAALAYLMDLLVFGLLGLEGDVTGMWRVITDICLALLVVLLILVVPAIRLTRKKT